MRIKYLFMVATATLVISACDNDLNNADENAVDGNSNFWYIYELAPKGIKSITTENYTENFDNNGRIVSSTETYGGSATYTYDSQGRITKVVSTSRQEGTTTETFEYKNDGKFCPVPMGPGSVFHVFEMGLAPGLSKVSFDFGEEGSAVMEYKFKGNELTISTTCKDMTMWNYEGEEVPAEYDDIIFEYQGDYPKKTSNDREFIGPMTYQANGMFDTYVEGFYSDNIPGFVYLERTRTVSKNFKNLMLAEREVTKYYNDGESTPYDVETIVFTYNEKGDLTKEDVTHTSAHGEHSVTTYEYEYDSKGNWVKMTGTIEVVGGSFTNTWSSERTITYY